MAWVGLWEKFCHPLLFHFQTQGGENIGGGGEELYDDDYIKNETKKKVVYANTHLMVTRTAAKWCCPNQINSEEMFDSDNTTSIDC